jgi:hypothetical protein
MDSAGDTAEAVGCPIRKSTDQSLLAAPHGLSQRAASFIASQCQGIHQMPFRRLISSALTRRVSRHIRMRHAQEKAHKELATSPQTHPAKMHHHDPTDCLPTAEATALSGHPRSLILFTCQRSHTRSRADTCFLSHRISRRLALAKRLCLVIEGHRSSLLPSSWWRRTGSNRRPHACKARALPTELRPHGEGTDGTVVGQGRLELPTSRLSSARSNQLSY